MKKEKKRKFGLLMSIAMIVGVVIGSGIFFKADDILVQTNGNVKMGCLVLFLGAVGIIFGGITISEWAKLTDDAGGLIAYAERAFSKVFAFLLGWFQTTVYFPALVAIVCFVASNYTVALFPKLAFGTIGIWVISLVYLVAIYLMNIYSNHLSELFQTSAMFIKLIPLILIAIFGLFFGDVHTISTHAISLPVVMSSTGAIVAVAFSYDGWAVAPSIGHEIKNSKRNLPLALIISPLIILTVYIGYFVGISLLLGPSDIMKMGDLAVYAAAEKLFGYIGQRLMLITVIISVLGTLNGLVVANIRVPYFLALRGTLPYSQKISQVSVRFKLSIWSTVISFIMVLVWLSIHFMSINLASIRQFGIDISAIPIVIMYLFYGLLYVGVIIRTCKGLIKNKVIGIVCPLLALAGALMILYGGLTASNGTIYLIVSFFILVSGLSLYLMRHLHKG